MPAVRSAVHPLCDQVRTGRMGILHLWRIPTLVRAWRQRVGHKLFAFLTAGDEDSKQNKFKIAAYS